MAKKSALVANKQALPTRAANKTKDSTFDRVYAFYHSKSRVELKPDEHQVRERWEKAWHILTTHRTVKRTVEMIERICHVGKSTAYDDVRSAMLLFGNPVDGMKEAKRAILETALIEGAQKAWRRGDLEAHLKYMKEYKEVNGLHLQEGDNLKEMLKNLKPHTIVFVSAPEQLQNEAKALMDNIPAVDTDYEDVDEAKANTD